MSIYIFELPGEDGETLRSGTFTGLFDRFFFFLFFFLEIQMVNQWVYRLRSREG